jgi:TDG/mug DNA glycosylase family protein
MRPEPMTSVGFDPVASGRSRILMLGSLPGRVSLDMRQYYAQPRNSFWRIMSMLLGFDETIRYQDRLEVLQRRGLALWDVCHSAHRVGSLDSAIDHASVAGNDFCGFLAQHERIALIVFNGTTAANLYERKVLPVLPPAMQAIRRLSLPSTSAAHAAMPFAEKLSRWSVLLDEESGLLPVSPQ